jgi:hypothetical protein
MPAKTASPRSRSADSEERAGEQHEPEHACDADRLAGGRTLAWTAVVPASGRRQPGTRSLTPTRCAGREPVLFGGALHGYGCERPADRGERVLAEQTATTFTPPTSVAQASREIDRLAARKRERGPHRELPDSAERPVYATAPAPDEVSGWGSSATWRSSSPARAAMGRPSGVGERTELARYRVSAGERVVYGQRINGCVRITDRPASGTGRSYLVERELERDGYSALKALVADYVEQARAFDAVPMASSILHDQLLAS